MTDVENKGWISGFWRRIGAFVIDSVVLGIVGQILGLVASDFFVRIDAWGRAFGFLIAMTYFGVLNSRIANGQTLGKRLLKIRVVDVANQPITLIRSLGRYSVLGLPFFLNGARFSNEALFSFWGYLLSMAIFGGMLSIVYLYIFNRSSRQSLHDLIFGTYVVNVGSERNSTPPIWKPHLAIVTAFFIIAAIAPAVTSRFVHVEPFADLLKSQSALMLNEKVLAAAVVSGKNFITTTTAGTRETSYVSASVFLKANNITDGDLAKALALTVIKNYPGALKKDVVIIDLIYGYDIGIASRWSNQSHRFNPSELDH